MISTPYFDKTLANSFILYKKKEFEYFIPKMRLDRKDNVELRKKILSMTSEDRKKLGINKSTLWYIKKNSRQFVLRYSIQKQKT